KSPAVPACFGPPLPETGLTGYLVEAVPSNACYPIEVPPASNRTPSGFFVLIRRYDCPFGTKILHAQQAGYQAAIIHNIYSDLLVSMAIKMKETRQQVLIPSVFIGGTAAKLLRRLKNHKNPVYQIYLNLLYNLIFSIYVLIPL
uniref:PA domain-containing protein n=1 Tax=Varanus komodoensis TaxID=61221 RepID=A0A8D2JCR9_VARKO